jgi:hypothetical protein
MDRTQPNPVSVTNHVDVGLCGGAQKLVDYLIAPPCGRGSRQAGLAYATIADQLIDELSKVQIAET